MNNKFVGNWIDGAEHSSITDNVLDKMSPANGAVSCQLAASNDRDVDKAVSAAVAAQSGWADKTPVERGNVLQQICRLMQDRKNDIAEIVARETGKSLNEALGETGAAIQQAAFFAGEGMRSFGRSLPSGMEGKSTTTIRTPRGVAALVVAANTPVANVAWKLFPALICGNGVVLKAAEDTPETAMMIARICKDAGLPDGVFNVIQGRGQDVGPALVTHTGVDVVSFTGSTRVGREIAASAGAALKHVSLELGGKNPFVVADDADIEHAVHWASLSAFSNAGQRCASGSRIIVMDAVYDAFRSKLVAKAQSLKCGISDDSDLGAVINLRQLENMETAVKNMTERGATLLCGGERSQEEHLAGGYFMRPTLLEGLAASDPDADNELFGPVAVLYRAADFQDALNIANRTSYGLTAAIHTRRFDRATWFGRRVRAGTVNVNIGTFGSEPHFPFGGFGASGNGTREPGTEALDVYSELKVISHWVDMTTMD